MSDRRYQVFISSTYRDLAEERQHVMQTIMQMDCIPAGMELFPAADEEQFQFIKRVIDDCDYYLLILGGRYGSLAADGLGYTEKEYDYAVGRGIKVVAFVHADPGSIAAAKTESDPDARAKLELFRQKVSTGRLVKEWRTAAELPGLVALSLSMTMKMFPAKGWVRGGATGNPELLADIVSLKQENDELKARVLMTSAATVVVSNLAQGDEILALRGASWVTVSNTGSWKRWDTKMSWNQIFWALAPHLLQPFGDATVKAKISETAASVAGPAGQGQQPTLDDHIFQTIKVQLMALGLINVEVMKVLDGTTSLFWSLTPAGKNKLLSIRSVRSAITASPAAGQEPSAQASEPANKALNPTGATAPAG